MAFDRRGFLGLGVVSAGLAAAAASFRTSLCDLLGIDVPILQAGMSGVAGPELVAEVSKAGGLGILTGALLEPEELRKRIRQVRALTDRPFGVNLLLHRSLQPPADPARIPEAAVTGAQTLLNHFRERLGLPERTDRKSTRLNSSHIQKSRMPSSA